MNNSTYLLEGHPLLRNIPADQLNKIDWHYISKEDYEEIENIMTAGVKLFDPFLIEDFYPQEMFDELLEICNSYDLQAIDFSHQMNKWEEGIQIPQKFMDYAVKRVKEALQIDDVMFAYHMYAHHQVTSEGRVPKLPLHLDWAPGSYMVDLHMGGNRDWGFVARYKNFITKPNQAIICQPQFDYHYRPSWNSTDSEEYYQALFFHLINLNHWCVPSSYPKQTRSDYLNNKYEFGAEFRNTEIFINFQKQRRHIFDAAYLYTNEIKQSPPIPWNELPTAEDQQIHHRKGVKPLKA